MKHLVFFFFVYLFVFNPLFAQSGPGGIGSIDGTSELVLWLEPSSITGLNDNDPILSWLDISGFANNVGQSVEEQKPLFNSNVLNGFPAITFDGSNDVLERPYNSDLNPNAFALFCVTKTSGGNGTYRSPVSTRYNAGVNDLNGFCLFANNSDSWSYWWGDGSTSSWQVLNGTSGISNWTSLCAMHDETKGYFYENGTGQGSAGFSYSPNTVNKFTVGSTFYYSGSSYDHYFNGQIAEVILFNRALPLGDRTLVDNYIAAKYGLTTSADRYSGDTNGDYDLNVAGIANENSNSNTSASSAGLIITNNGYLDSNTDGNVIPNGDYLMFGHKVVENSLVAVSTTNTNFRWDRAWYIDKTNGDGEVDGNLNIIFDFSDGGIGNSPSGTFYLLKSTNAGSSWEEVISSSTIQNTDEVLFSNVSSSNFNDGDLITIGHTDAGMPVELITFTAEFMDKSVILKWQTATEVNNYGFEVERACLHPKNRDFAAATWQKIAFVEGAGNSNSPEEYSYVDNSKLDGKYQYRLKQIDINGNYKYSDIVEVNINSALPTKFELSQNYPNPFNPATVIRYSIPVVAPSNAEGLQNVTLKVYDILGNEVTTLVSENQPAGNYEVTFNASNLSSGMYFYRLQTSSGFIATKKLLLMK